MARISASAWRTSLIAHLQFASPNKVYPRPPQPGSPNAPRLTHAGNPQRTRKRLRIPAPVLRGDDPGVDELAMYARIRLAQEHIDSPLAQYVHDLFERVNARDIHEWHAFQSNDQGLR